MRGLLIKINFYKFIAHAGLLLPPTRAVHLCKVGSVPAILYS
jgi:hypothetical protein